MLTPGTLSPPMRQIIHGALNLVWDYYVPFRAHDAIPINPNPIYMYGVATEWKRHVFGGLIFADCDIAMREKLLYL